jgi:hypothetical protein
MQISLAVVELLCADKWKITHGELFQFKKPPYRHHKYLHFVEPMSKVRTKVFPFKKYVRCLQVNKNTCGFCLLNYYANKCVG